MSHIHTLYTPMLVMGGVITLSNVLVQFPLGEWLTYGALTYPIAFLVTDLVTRTYGVASARQVISIGFMVGIIASFVSSLFALTTLRIAIASASAFLVSHLLDLTVFSRLRHDTWWFAPVVSSTLASLIDTCLFFSLAFSTTTFLLLPDSNGWALELVPFLGIGHPLPLWVSLAVADLGIKLIMVIVLLLPYRMCIQSRLTYRV